MKLGIVIVIRSAKHRQNPCSGPPTDSMNYRKSWLEPSSLSLSLPSGARALCEDDWRLVRPEKLFELPLNVIGKLKMAFLTGRSWRVIKSQLRVQNEIFGAVSQAKSQTVNSKAKKEIKTRPSAPKHDQKIIVNQSEPIIMWASRARGARERSPISK